ncbi:hypothetical protein K1X12_15055 [Hyphomonas sp. WL0036]|uniref:RyR domain-containing protein n=1 Tax=Hyphomonas sediminis TaxID=2866160 RepID=UPI001C81A9BD|nr:RyR domain-containing protein [Hyphomonas sediminis]MBY9068222.1 hypothetical protein [Hyphomonas sediminis]
MSFTKLFISMPSRYKWAIFLGLTAIGFGGVGWWRSSLELTHLDILYRALSVFGFNDTYRDLPAGQFTWTLEVARFLGPASLLIVASAALFDVLGKTRIRRTAAKIKDLRGVIVGASPYAFSAIEGARRDGSKLLHLGANATNKEGALFRLPWDDRSRKELMLATYASRAKYILVSAETDSETLVLAVAATKLSKHPRVTAIVSGGRLADDYSDLLANGNKGCAYPLRILAASSLSARHLHLHNPPFLRARAENQKRVHAVIVGFGETGEALARDLAVNCLTLGLDRPRLTVIDPLMAEREAALRQRVPELDETVVFEGVLGGFGNGLNPPKLLDPEHDKITHAYICLGNDGDTLAAEGALRQWLRLSGQPDVPVFLKLRESGILASSENTTVFGSTDQTVELSGWTDDAFDDAASTLHRFYRTALSEHRKEAHGLDTAQNWDSQTPDIQRSNRAVVSHISAKLFSVGIDATHWLGKASIPYLQHESGMLGRIEALARLEHDRWNAERRWSGWRYSGTPRKDGGKKLDDLKMHPDLVPYDLLDVESQEYDRASIRILEKLLTTRASAKR